MTFDITIAWALDKRLKAARERASIDQADMAKRLRVARTTVSNWERGISEPNVSQFVQWSELTGTPLEWLAEGVHAKAPAEAGADVRHEGFEPPTFWSVVPLAAVVILAAMRQAVTRG